MAWDAYLTLEGVSGESKRDGHEGEIEVLSFSFGASNPSGIGVGGGAGTGTVSLSGFNVVKNFDASSAEIFQRCCTGEHFPEAKMTIYKAGGEKALAYLVYDFEEVFVDNVSWSGGGDIPTENINLTFGKVTVTYTEQSADGTAFGDHVGSWDVRKGVA